ncbi:hypothetical protein MTR67_051287 [Solanum verrucosum]|uniref:Transposase MuDR plant domain-containing protein n=1 Tax=Solanum verrucosum TaxID=315347 RepID=A0AAF0ZYZ7_SOLVR|nr:hypothetical protein MTR67_051287 [Solanum verrucosum]
MGPNIGYDETNIGIRKSLVDTLGGDESYYLSDEAPRFEIDDKTCWGDGEEVDQVVHKPVRRKKTPNRVVFDENSEKVVWELGLVFRSVDEFRVTVTRYAVQEHIQIEKYVNEPSRVRVRCCKETCPWLLCARIERRRVFWRIAKSTFEDELKDNIQAMKKLGKDCLDDLLWYNLDTWCKRYFQDYSKCDVVDNNMAESFNAWILSARSWKLRGIPCPHGVAALHYKELEPINYVASCYSKETYLSTYAYFIQPMNNMKMWPTSNNPIIKPPKIKKMPGRPSKDCVDEEECLNIVKLVLKQEGRDQLNMRTQVEDKQELLKRPKMVGVGIYQAEDGFTTLNQPGLPSRKAINTGTRVTKRADVVTGDIVYTPIHGFKWKGKTTITSTNLERMRAEKVIQTRSAVTATTNSQSQTSSSRKTHVPWK